MHDVILHAFDWRIADIAANAQRIAGVGYGAVLIPPPLYSDPAGPEWWQRYQPKDYRILRSFLGNRADLEMAIAALHDNGVRVYADIVFNHMANESRQDRLCFPGEAELLRYRQERAGFEKDRLYGNLDEGLFSPVDFNTDGNIQDWMNTHEATEHSLSRDCQTWISISG